MQVTEENESPKADFGDLGGGDAFEANGILYIKCRYSVVLHGDIVVTTTVKAYNAFNPKTGTHIHFSNDYQVLPKPGTKLTW